MREVYRRIDKVAGTAATVLVAGESGSGKELVARTIHDRSPRAGAPFVAVNCGAIPANLIEAELFGYEKGAFTGAARQHRGCFERAEGGTLFLDEITEMAPEMQVRLLRVLETGTYHRVGGEDELRARARIVAATNRDPQQAVREGRLREDLLYRLAVFPIRAAAAARARGRRRAPGRALPRRPERRGRHAQGLHPPGDGDHPRAPAGRATCASCATPSSARTSLPTTRWSSISAALQARARTTPACALRSARRSRKSSAR